MCGARMKDLNVLYELLLSSSRKRCRNCLLVDYCFICLEGSSDAIPTSKFKYTAEEIENLLLFSSYWESYLNNENKRKGNLFPLCADKVLTLTKILLLDYKVKKYELN